VGWVCHTAHEARDRVENVNGREVAMGSEFPRQDNVPIYGTTHSISDWIMNVISFYEDIIDSGN
jgi:hypothetical protein